MTPQEALEKLDPCYQWIAQDSDGQTYAYEHPPIFHRVRGYWGAQDLSKFTLIEGNVEWPRGCSWYRCLWQRRGVLPFGYEVKVMPSTNPYYPVVDLHPLRSEMDKREDALRKEWRAEIHELKHFFLDRLYELLLGSK